MKHDYLVSSARGSLCYVVHNFSSAASSCWVFFASVSLQMAIICSRVQANDYCLSNVGNVSRAWPGVALLLYWLHKSHPNPQQSYQRENNKININNNSTWAISLKTAVTTTQRLPRHLSSNGWSCEIYPSTRSAFFKTKQQQLKF